MSFKCDHITECSLCDMQICSYCVEDCSGCADEFCERCYKTHQISCKGCDAKLCPKEIKDKELCPVCEMKND